MSGQMKMPDQSDHLQEVLVGQHATILSGEITESHTGPKILPMERQILGVSGMQH